MHICRCGLCKNVYMYLRERRKRGRERSPKICINNHQSTKSEHSRCLKYRILTKKKRAVSIRCKSKKDGYDCHGLSMPSHHGKKQRNCISMCKSLGKFKGCEGLKRYQQTRRITFCIKLKFLQSFDRKGAQSPIKFFSLEPLETISCSAFSESVSRIASSEAAMPSSAFILLSCNKKLKQVS